MKKEVWFACTLLCLLALSAAGQTFEVKPGLWETTMNNQMAGMPPIPDSVLAKLTPEQRARMEAAMKARGAGGSKPNAYKHCVTKESMKKALSLADSGRTGCQHTLVSSSARTQEVHMECTHGEMHSVGDVKIEAPDAEHISGKGHVKSTGSGDRTMDMDISFSSRWVGPDCGDVLPN